MEDQDIGPNLDNEYRLLVEKLPRSTDNDEGDRKW